MLKNVSVQDKNKALLMGAQTLSEASLLELKALLQTHTQSCHVII